MEKNKIDQLRERFTTLCSEDIDLQLEFFLKSFIFALGNEWKEVIRLSNEFKKYCRDGGEGKMDLNPVQAADFLQKYGITRTASQRTAELKDVDLNSDNRISFIEYMLLHYKSMILNEYYKRIGADPVEDLSDGAIGIVGVGNKLMDELFFVKKGLDPEVEKAIEEFTAKKKERTKKIDDLQARADQGGVKGLAARNELEQLCREDPTQFNRLEITLNAAKRMASKNSGELALNAKKQQEEEEAKKKKEESRKRLAEKAAMFNNK